MIELTRGGYKFESVVNGVSSSSINGGLDHLL
jgi:hypothetical protein